MAQKYPLGRIHPHGSGGRSVTQRHGGGAGSESPIDLFPLLVGLLCFPAGLATGEPYCLVLLWIFGGQLIRGSF